MRTIQKCRVALNLLAALPLTAYAHEQGAAATQEKLESEYKITTTTDDRSDIVKEGSSVALHKGKILMVAATSSVNPCVNTYRDGRITSNLACKAGHTIRVLPGVGSRIHADKAPATRNFVAGEKLWVTKIDVRDTGKESVVVFDLFSNAVDGVRYMGVLTIPMGSSTPTPDGALKVAAEVITVAPSENAKDGDQAQAAAPAPAEPAAAPIAPPPPPPSDPARISEGQTIDQVAAALGPPQKIVKLGAKEIYIYRDLKVTFADGKVKDVE